jgi:hypothetical protein
MFSAEPQRGEAAIEKFRAKVAKEAKSRNRLVTFAPSAVFARKTFSECDKLGDGTA